MIHRYLHGAAQYRPQLPALQATEGTALDDTYDIANFRRLLFIVGVKLFSLLDNPFIDRMRGAPRHFDHNCFGHLGRDDLAYFFVLMSGTSL